MSSTRGGSPAALMLVFLILMGFMVYLQQFCTPVMLPLIGDDLNLNSTQLGLIWGMATFGGLFLSVPGGLLGDKVGPRWGIFIVVAIVAVTYGIRGFARDTVLLSVMMFIGGGVVGSIPPLATKAVFTWFAPEKVGAASGMWWSFNRIGMAVGAAISATIVAVALNGWANTFFLYAGILLLFGILWLVIVREPPASKLSSGVPFREAVAVTTRSRDIWLCVIVNFGIIGLNVGFVGYLPTYLQSIGWQTATSSLALTAYFLVAVISGTLIPALSDKAGLRKIFFIVPSFLCVAAVGSMALTEAHILLWLLVIIAGLAFGSLMPMLNAIVAEIKGIGARYAGTAISIGSGIGGLGGLVFSTVSGKLAEHNAAMPFVFDAVFCLLCLVPLFFIKETGTGGRADTVIRTK